VRQVAERRACEGQNGEELEIRLIVRQGPPNRKPLSKTESLFHPEVITHAEAMEKV
jgi:hypothetical protein